MPALGKDTALGRVRLGSGLGAETRSGSHHGDPRADLEAAGTRSPAKGIPSPASEPASANHFWLADGGARRHRSVLARASHVDVNTAMIKSSKMGILDCKP